MVARVVPVEPFDLVVFGATGDLARRKLIPALYHRMHDGQMPESARVVGAARTDLDGDAFRAIADASLKEFVEPDGIDPVVKDKFLRALDYVRVDAMANDGWGDLAEKLPDENRVRAYYLSVAPDFFGPVAEHVADAGLATAKSRIVIEKPLGHDLASARRLNKSFAGRFEERQIYRIDHYLGKETVQNLMALRFANALFEPLWNARSIDHVQITVAETVGVEGRGAYYDHVGAMRDMVQNHLLQLLCLIAMEPPAKFEPDPVRDEKVKVLRSLAPIRNPDYVVRGQYGEGIGIPSYLDDVGTQESRAETYVALKAEIANWRWAGVPFYLRTGKRMKARVSEIGVTFKPTPHSIFPATSGRMQQNVLTIRLQPNEGIRLSMTIKDPGPGGMRLAPAELDMTFADSLGQANKLRMPDAYERLVMDVIRGDQTLFMRFDEVEAAWAWIDPIIEGFEERGDPPEVYNAFGRGPDGALAMMHRDGRRWRDFAAA